MFIAQSPNRFSSPCITKIIALLQLFNYTVLPTDTSIKVILHVDGNSVTEYIYDNNFTLTEAVEDAILSNYKAFNIKLYEEVQ